MSSPSVVYNPQPTKAWYRVQSCTYPIYNLTAGNDIVYNNYTRQYTTYAKSNFDSQMAAKGNVLQYKANSANLTRNQQYAQLARGISGTRKSCYASQTETYTNPNVCNFLRVNAVTVPLEVPNDNCDCSCNSYQDGGSLVCNKIVNPCTGDVIEKTNPNELCFLSTCSDVPGPAVPLCWYPYIQTWYPKQQLQMNNTTDKWPINSKDIQVALKPAPPFLTLGKIESTSITLSWVLSTCDLFPITSFNVYVNNNIILNILNNSYYTLQLQNMNNDDVIYMTSVSSLYESPPSNSIVVIIK